MTEREKFEVCGDEKAWKKYLRDGSEDGVKRISADRVLKAVVEEKDIVIKYAVIDGDLDIRTIPDPDQIKHLEGKKPMPIINGDVNITYSEIRGIVNFTESYEGLVDIGAIFNGRVNFFFTTFSNLANFNDNIFSRGAEFASVIFCDHANFSYAISTQGVFFVNTKFKSSVSFKSAGFDRLYFHNANFRNIADFSNVIIKYPCEFSGVRFKENTTLKGLWNLGLGRIKRLHWTVTEFGEFNTNMMDSSSYPYLKRYIDDELWIESWRKHSWGRRFLFVIWELMSHCGRSFGLWAGWSAFFAYIFARVYRELGCDDIAFNVSQLINSGKQPSFLGYLYYSIVTFTTLGFGDIVPLTDKARVIVGLEVILGYVMLGGLISIFANKFARRS